MNSRRQGAHVHAGQVEHRTNQALDVGDTERLQPQPLGGRQRLARFLIGNQPLLELVRTRRHDKKQPRVPGVGDDGEHETPARRVGARKVVGKQQHRLLLRHHLERLTQGIAMCPALVPRLGKPGHRDADRGNERADVGEGLWRGAEKTRSLSEGREQLAGEGAGFDPRVPGGARAEHDERGRPRHEQAYVLLAQSRLPNAFFAFDRDDRRCACTRGNEGAVQRIELGGPSHEVWREERGRERGTRAGPHRAKLTIEHLPEALRFRRCYAGALVPQPHGKARVSGRRVGGAAGAAQQLHDSRVRLLVGWEQVGPHLGPPKRRTNLSPGLGVAHETLERPDESLAQALAFRLEPDPILLAARIIGAKEQLTAPAANAVGQPARRQVGLERRDIELQRPLAERHVMRTGDQRFAKLALEPQQRLTERLARVRFGPFAPQKRRQLDARHRFGPAGDEGEKHQLLARAAEPAARAAQAQRPKCLERQCACGGLGGGSAHRSPSIDAEFTPLFTAGCAPGHTMEWNSSRFSGLVGRVNTTTPPPGDIDRAPHFAYYMLRVHRPASEDMSALAGTVEYLATGEKQRFTTAEELVRLISTGAHARFNMRRPLLPGKSGTE